MPRRTLIRMMSLAVLGFGLAGCGGKDAAIPAVRVQPHSVTLTWDASVSPVSGYRVYRSTNPSAYPDLLAVTPAGTTQYVDSTVEAGHTYFYVVTAFDSANTESVFSNKFSVAIPAP